MNGNKEARKRNAVNLVWLAITYTLVTGLVLGVALAINAGGNLGSSQANMNAALVTASVLFVISLVALVGAAIFLRNQLA